MIGRHDRSNFAEGFNPSIPFRSRLSELDGILSAIVVLIKSIYSKLILSENDEPLYICLYSYSR